ncbi:CHAP domain-containing protein [Nocardioides sp.]|uniref:CHAP domain-containing protein n=1 Tax=Nocardioides sp. TaxID=35761 RepID=UPI002ED0824F
MPRFVGLLVLIALLVLPTGPALAAPGQPGDKGPKEEPVWTGVPGTNAAHDDFGYPWPAAPDCDESNVSSGGCINDGLGFFQGQCVSWVAYRLNQRNGFAFSNWYAGRHWGSAVYWKKVAKSLGHKPDEVPAVGAVGWYSRGHVSYVEAVNSDGSIVISEMNIDGHNGFHFATVYPGDHSWPDKFLHLADVIPVDTTAPDRPAHVSVDGATKAPRVTWTKSADNIGTTGYRVMRNGVPLATTDTPSYVDRQATPGQSYTYSVEAFDEAGNVSAAGSATQRGTAPANRRLRARFRGDDATVVQTTNGPVACGRLGRTRDQRVGCRVRTLDGVRTVRAGREVPWGEPNSRRFLADEHDRVWYCRVVNDRSACLPFDLESLSWGFDRIKPTRNTATYGTWLMTGLGPARCGYAGDRPTCSVVTSSGWRSHRTARDLRPGDPISRAFVQTSDGVSFCRVVGGRAACTALEGPRLDWTRTVAVGRDQALGRWTLTRLGPAVCEAGQRRSCTVVARPRESHDRTVVSRAMLRSRLTKA